MQKPERKPCADAGHCWHVEDGQVYQRHAGQEPGTVSANCCYCPESRELPTGSRNNPGKPDLTVEHGRMVTPIASVTLRQVKAI